jgi:hypothetical protein
MQSQTPNSKLQTPNSKLQTPNSKLQHCHRAFNNKSKLSTSNLLCVFLIINLLMNSVPASPQISVNNFNQHYSNLIILIGGSNFLVEAREFFFAQPTPISETQELRESEVVRLEAHIPEKAFVGQQIQLGAIPLDKNNITVSGIKLSWEIEDTDGKIQSISNEQFIPEKFGEYSIMKWSSFAGHETHASFSLF